MTDRASRTAANRNGSVIHCAALGYVVDNAPRCVLGAARLVDAQIGRLFKD
jgi:hypothetical protein